MARGDYDPEFGPLDAYEQPDEATEPPGEREGTQPDDLEEGSGSVEASAAADELPKQPLASAEGSSAASVPQVLAGWLLAGPLVHEPTGIAQLDELTAGGPTYGTRWYLAGAPDAGKTALLIQIAHVFLSRGVVVGLLAVDEDPDDVVTRLAQRVGYQRTHCETRDPTVIEQMRLKLGKLPLRIYEASWTIEAAADDLAAYARQLAIADPTSYPRGPRAFLGIDSIQTVHCAADRQAAAIGRELPEVSAVTARSRAIRSVATRFRLIAVATSEQGRGSYRSSDPGQQTSALASAKWSGAVEYSARVLLALRPVANQPDLVELEVAKNKHGPRDQKLYLRIDRASQTLLPVPYDAPPVVRADRDEVAKGRVVSDAAKVARVLEAKGELNARDLRSEVLAATGIGSDRVRAAVALLGDAVTSRPGPRNAKLTSFEPQRLPVEVRRALEALK